MLLGPSCSSAGSVTWTRTDEVTYVTDTCVGFAGSLHACAAAPWTLYVSAKHSNNGIVSGTPTVETVERAPAPDSGTVFLSNSQLFLSNAPFFLSDWPFSYQFFLVFWADGVGLVFSARPT